MKIMVQTINHLESEIEAITRRLDDILLKELMIEIAWAAVRTKGSYYKDKYHRLKSRRGAKRAVVAIAHRITKAVYHIIKHGKSFVDLGEAYLMSKSKE